MATAGTVIAGKYELTRPLGSGSMGDVWVAHHLSLGEDVALKVLSEVPIEAAESPAAAAARFHFEARVAARLSRRTRHIVRVTDHGEEAGTAYLVMELLEGQTLEARLLRGPVPPAEIATIVAQVARALTEAHRADVIHRDLKPANIFLTRDEDGDLMVKLLDFGIARTMRTHRVPLAFETGRGLVFGTPAYMSPEQARAVAPLDHRCDLWALATVAYEALTTALPVAAAQTHELFRNLCAGELVPIHQRDPSLPGALRGFFDRAFAPRPEDRFATAADVAAAFERAVEGAGTAETVAAAGAVESGTLAMVSTQGPLEPARRAEEDAVRARTGTRGRRLRWAVAAMASAVLGLGGAGIAWYAVMSSGKAMAADASRPAAREEPIPPTLAETSIVALAPAAESPPTAEAAASAGPTAVPRAAAATTATSATSHAIPLSPPEGHPRATPRVVPTPPPSAMPTSKPIDKSDVF